MKLTDPGLQRGAERSRGSETMRESGRQCRAGAELSRGLGVIVPPSQLPCLLVLPFIPTIDA
jgi:hypothetical protein